MRVPGAFLVFGPQCPPAVVLLEQTRLDRLNRQISIAAKHGKDSLRHDAYQAAFRLPAQWAVPCWVPGSMERLATEYTGEHQDRVRGLAACIATGTPYGGPEPGEAPKGGNGGQKAPTDPAKPKPRKPSGGNAAKPQTAAEALLFGGAQA